MDWSPIYSVGHAVLDEQHRSLFGIIGELQGHLDAAAPDEGVRETLDRLVRYTREHFTLEESMMARARYPELESHRAAHAALCARLDQLRERLAAADPTVRDELYFMLLSEWLASHILGQDKAYVPHIAACAAEAPVGG